MTEDLKTPDLKIANIEQTLTNIVICLQNFRSLIRGLFFIMIEQKWHPLHPSNGVPELPHKFATYISSSLA